jgi:cob(I)alamin adenosyltransferase
MQFHLYYGEGKGKTTAALGQALRAWGWGGRVLIVQFLKDDAAPSGEVKAAAAMGRRWRILRSRLPCPVLREPARGEREELRGVTAALIEKAVKEVGKGRYDVVVLDEALAAWKLGLLKVGEIRSLRRVAGEAGVKLLVATGRWVPKSLMAAADLVTEMGQKKHPFELGKSARKGIEY